MSVKGFPVKQVLVAERLDIRAEYYAGITIDREAKSVVLILSAAGGVDIEEIAAKEPAEDSPLYADGKRYPGHRRRPAALARGDVHESDAPRSGGFDRAEHVQALPREGLLAGGGESPGRDNRQGPAGRGRRQGRARRQRALQAPGTSPS